MPIDSGDVADAVAATIDALALADAPNALKRARPLVLDGDTFPLLTVSVGDGYEVEVQGRQAAATRRVHWRFPATVALTAKNRGRVSGSQTLREWAAAVDAALLNWTTGLKANGLPTVNEVTARGEWVADPAAMERGYDRLVNVYEVEAADAV